jgi:hypothetical protein
MCWGANTRNVSLPLVPGTTTRENSNGTGMSSRRGASLMNSPPPSGFSMT